MQILSPLSVTSIADVTPDPRSTPVSTISVTFSLPIDTSSLTAYALTLTDNGTPVTLTGVSLTLVQGTSSTYEVGDLSGLTSAAGAYVLTVNAGGIKDQYGNVGTGVLSTSWVLSGATTPTITWANPADIVYGTPLSGTQLDATASVTGTFIYTPALGTLMDVGSNQTLSVLFTPDDTTDYTSASTTVTINVSKATPTITWANPADIVYGTALSGTQLDAAASVPGTFLYNPTPGRILGAGSDQTLSVIFTPDDATDYTSASATATINVLAATPSISWTSPADIGYGTALGGAQLDATAGIPGTFSYTPARERYWARGATRLFQSSSLPTTRSITRRRPQRRRSTSCHRV